MKTKEEHLSPTLWRTCRVLANPNRLRCLKAVLKTPGLTVEDVAASVRLSESKTSLALRALQSRGILSSRRRSRWVHYYPETDPAVGTAEPFLDAARHALIDNKMSEEDFKCAMQAYTHPRRIAIVQALAHAENLQPEDLSVMLDISPEALARHLRKLQTLGVVAITEKGCKLEKPGSSLAKALLRIVLS
ncbi:MAG: ArsR family transcriptional regulator [Kiritimatiellia bacterium]|jgi:DNA-binding transcriptional ArsR family regulator